jgi:hypothetical protein
VNQLLPFTVASPSWLISRVKIEGTSTNIVSIKDTRFFQVCVWQKIVVRGQGSGVSLKMVILVSMPNLAKEGPAGGGKN